MDLQEPIVSVDLSKLLLEHNFDVATEHSWGTCPSYNGQPLDLDDEMELRDEGITDIVIMDVLYDIWWVPSKDIGSPAPTHAILNEWFIERWGVCILVVPYITTEGVMWCCEAKRLRNNMIESLFNKAGFSDRAECFEYGATKVLNEIIC